MTRAASLRIVSMRDTPSDQVKCGRRAVAQGTVEP